ncbi:hypothetical protein DL98DRAFT_533217 [Cadophora sp. DSE1049]|nr:hypothetical protein DL98DRAFT_533217 [Cadophora sp. DSE1049]
MPNAHAYEHSSILLSQTPWKEMSPLERARLKKARAEKVQYKGGSSIATPSESGGPQPPVNITGVPLYERSSQRQRDRLNFPFADMAQDSPNTITPRKHRPDSTNKPTIKEMATTHPRPLNPAGITSSVGRCVTTSSGPVFNDGRPSMSKELSAKLQGQPGYSAQKMETIGSQSPARQPPISPGSLAAVDDQPEDNPQITEFNDLLEAAGMMSISSQETASFGDEHGYWFVEATAKEIALTDTSDLDAILLLSPKTGSSRHICPGLLQASSSAAMADIAAQPTMTRECKRKPEVHVNTEAIQGQAKKKRQGLNSQVSAKNLHDLRGPATSSSAKKAYQSPYPPTQNAQFPKRTEAFPECSQEQFSSTLSTSQTFGPVSRSLTPAQSQHSAVRPEGVVGSGFSPVVQTVHRTIKGDVTINHGPVTYNAKNQNFMQMPQPTNHQDQWSSSQKSMNTQENGLNILGNVNLADSFQDFPDFNAYHPPMATFISTVDTIPSYPGLTFNRSANVPNRFQCMNGQLPGYLPQGQSLQPMSSVGDFNNPGYVLEEAANVASLPQHMGPGHGMSNNHRTMPTKEPYGDYSEYLHEKFLQNQQDDISAPVKTAAGFSIQNASQDHGEPHIPGSELPLYFKEPIGLTEMPNYFGTRIRKDMPYHVWQQGKDLICSTLRSPKTHCWVSPQTVTWTRLFDPEELKWLREQAEKGIQRPSLKLEPVSLDEFTYKFRQRYCWGSDCNLKWRLNDALLKLQEKPTYYRVSRNSIMPPWIVNSHWQTVYLEMFPGTFDGRSFAHAYWFDWSERWKLSVVNKDEKKREDALENRSWWSSRTSFRPILGLERKNAKRMEISGLWFYP